MQNARPLIICFQISRCISSSSMYSSVNRESKFMKKLIYGSRKSKRKWYDTESCSVVSINPIDKSPSMHTKRRMIIRDKLFMQHITDMLSMGHVSDIIKGDIEITHVKITQDFKYVNVFYISSNDTSVDQAALQKCAGIIRHELSQLHVIGIVPPIQFIENKHYHNANEIERRLAMINFEENSEILSEQMQSDVSSVDQISYEEPVVNDNSKTDEFYIELPIMRHDVLGLDHYKIMSRITSAVSKSKKAAQKRMLNMNTSIDKSDPISKEVEFVTQEEQRKIFSDFLIKRRREKQRIVKQSNMNNEKLLNNFEEEINNEESDYENDVDDEYINDEYNNDYDNDDFQDETRK